jgi:hypothetical protein
MRPTAERNEGIGIIEPQTKPDVAGTILTQGFTFSDRAVRRTAAGRLRCRLRISLSEIRIQQVTVTHSAKNRGHNGGILTAPLGHRHRWHPEWGAIIS